MADPNRPGSKNFDPDPSLIKRRILLYFLSSSRLAWFIVIAINFLWVLDGLKARFEGIERNKVVCTLFETNGQKLHVISLVFNLELFEPSSNIVQWSV